MASSPLPAPPTRVRAWAPARVAAFGAVVALAGCGGASSATTSSRFTAAPPTGARSRPAGQLRTQIASAFRQGLYRMAVMDQPADDAADLGQELPTGRVRQVRCTSDRTPPGQPSVRVSSCLVRWQHVDDRADRTLLRVRQDRHGCWNATPRPPLPDRYDATQRNYSEHPLNVLSAVRPGC